MSYGDFERGRRYPTVENLIKISEMLGTTPNELLGYKTLLFTEAEAFWRSAEYEVELDEGGIIKKISFASREVFVRYTQNAMRQFDQHIRNERRAFLDKLIKRD